jgi:hypothetical protein
VSKTPQHRLSSQGLGLWQDERRRWLGMELQAERGFWALGEAIVDAVVARYPAAFDGAAVVGVE